MVVVTKWDFGVLYCMKNRVCVFWKQTRRRINFWMEFYNPMHFNLQGHRLLPNIFTPQKSCSQKSWSYSTRHQLISEILLNEYSKIQEFKIQYYFTWHYKLLVVVINIYTMEREHVKVCFIKKSEISVLYPLKNLKFS